MFKLEVFREHELGKNIFEFPMEILAGHAGQPERGPALYMVFCLPVLSQLSILHLVIQKT